MLGIGQVSLDRVAVLPRWPARGGKLALAEAPAERAGGQVATAVLATARLGLRAALVGAVGDDAEADGALAPLRAAGVSLDGVRRVAGASTRCAWILVDAADGERTVVAWRDPALALAPRHLSRAAVAGARALLLDAEDPDAAVWAAARAREAGVPSVLDADRADPARLALARQVDFPIVSRAFADQISETGSPVEALRALAAPGVRMPVVTLGEQGAVAWHEGRRLDRPAVPVAVRDSTGAGDVFRGAFVWGLLQGLGPADVLAAAATAAALGCRGAGAQGALPTARELRTHLAAGRGGEGDPG